MAELPPLPAPEAQERILHDLVPLPEAWVALEEAIGFALASERARAADPAPLGQLGDGRLRGAQRGPDAAPVTLTGGRDDPRRQIARPAPCGAGEACGS